MSNRQTRLVRQPLTRATAAVALTLALIPVAGAAPGASSSIGTLRQVGLEETGDGQESPRAQLAQVLDVPPAALAQGNRSYLLGGRFTPASRATAGLEEGIPNDQVTQAITTLERITDGSLIQDLLSRTGVGPEEVTYVLWMPSQYFVNVLKPGPVVPISALSPVGNLRPPPALSTAMSDGDFSFYVSSSVIRDGANRADLQFVLAHVPAVIRALRRAVTDARMWGMGVSGEGVILRLDHITVTARPQGPSRTIGAFWLRTAQETVDLRAIVTVTRADVAAAGLEEGPPKSPTPQAALDAAFRAYRAAFFNPPEDRDWQDATRDALIHGDVSELAAYELAVKRGEIQSVELDGQPIPAQLDRWPETIQAIQAQLQGRRIDHLEISNGKMVLTSGAGLEETPEATIAALVEALLPDGRFEIPVGQRGAEAFPRSVRRGPYQFLLSRHLTFRSDGSFYDSLWLGLAKIGQGTEAVELAAVHGLRFRLRGDADRATDWLGFPEEPRKISVDGASFGGKRGWEPGVDFGAVTFDLSAWPPGPLVLEVEGVPAAPAAQPPQPAWLAVSAFEGRYAAQLAPEAPLAARLRQALQLGPDEALALRQRFRQVGLVEGEASSAFVYVQGDAALDRALEAKVAPLADRIRVIVEGLPFVGPLARPAVIVKQGYDQPLHYYEPEALKGQVAVVTVSAKVSAALRFLDQLPAEALMVVAWDPRWLPELERLQALIVTFEDRPGHWVTAFFV